MAKSVVLLVIAILGWGFICTSNATCTGFGYELLMAKLEYLEEKLLAIQVETREQTKQTKSHLSEQISDVLKQQTAKLEYLEDKLQENHMETKRYNRDYTNILSGVMEKQTTLVDQSKILKAFIVFNLRKHSSDSSRLLQAYSEGRLISSCQQIAKGKAANGVFWLSDYGFEVYCEQSLHDGGWKVIQNRDSGTVNFTRNWAEYKEGFGDLRGEFWLGLDKIHQLTTSKPHELLIHLQDFKGVQKYARYDAFAIGSEAEGYVLKTLGIYSGTAGDSFSYHKGSKFYTPDEDYTEVGCAKDYKAGWWYGNPCYYTNLNGVYGKLDTTRRVQWKTFNNCYCSLKISRMMIREV